MQHSILLIEDDLEISEMVGNYLAMEGASIIRATNGEEAQRLFRTREFDLVILDLMLPKQSGMEVLKSIRETSVVPILIMSAKDSDVDKALGLGFGADDYITKPFSIVELKARVNAAIRRAKQYSNSAAKPAEQKPLQLLDLEIDSDNFSVIKRGSSIQLTSKEFQMIHLFAEHPKRVFTKAQIYQSVWNDDYFGDENVINVHMRRLREKIEDDPSNPRYIKTIWGIGYKVGED